MSAVSQSYPNYLGGLNEQPDELKKPGQLVDAFNVIPDPTTGLTRRPGFQQIATLTEADPAGTWFEVELSNQVNSDYIYYGNVRQDGKVVIYNQDGVSQSVRYTEDNASVVPHKKYEYFATYTDKEGESRTNVLVAFDENSDELDVYNTSGSAINGYFRHSSDDPLKYCVSKSHVVFANAKEVPILSAAKNASDSDKSKYYSFVSLKVIDTQSYDYIFKVFGASDVIDTYRYITEVEADRIDDVDSDYDKDTTLPLQTEGPFRFDLDGPGIDEKAVVELTFTGQVQQLKSSDGDGYRNEARYSWSTRIITPGKGFKKGQTYKKTLDGVAGGPDLEVTFKINDVNTVTGTVNQDVNPGDVTDEEANGILRALQTGFQGNPTIDNAIIVGNGIYLESDEPFSVSTAEIAVADVINSQKLEDDLVPLARINSVGDLPVECYAGFVVEIDNSLDGENNYFLQFNAESETGDIDQPTSSNITKADGYWEEIAKPYEQHNPRNGTLPHMITIARQSTQDKFVFVVSPIEYEKRTAGTALDNPSMFIDNARITDINYYKNRLFFFTSVGTVISSRAGEINNLFLNTAISLSLIDPLDVVANSNQRVAINGSAIVNNGMVLFGDSEQYMLTTNSDVLSSETVNVTKVANYTFDPNSKPIYLGTNLGFISNGLTRFYEMTNLYERGPVDINERSQQVQDLFARRFDMPVSSREQSVVMIYKRYTGPELGDSSPNLMLYRFRQENSQESSQTSWVKWQLEDLKELNESVKRVAFASLPQDKVFVVAVDSSQTCHLWRLGTGAPYRDGWTNSEDGVPYKTIIKFPTIYARSGDNSDVMANLTIHRVKLSTAAIGTYDLTIERRGYDTYKILVEQTPADEYYSDAFPDSDEKIETVPIYTRNKNLTLTMSTDYNAPLTLRSLTWEGDYNRPYYKSV
jgi:hypothetical protein